MINRYLPGLLIFSLIVYMALGPYTIHLKKSAVNNQLTKLETAKKYKSSPELEELLIESRYIFHRNAGRREAANKRVVRGGSHGDGPYWALKTYFRYYRKKDTKEVYTGFRLVLER